jgi:hypothetical protein
MLHIKITIFQLSSPLFLAVASIPDINAFIPVFKALIPDFSRYIPDYILKT